MEAAERVEIVRDTAAEGVEAVRKAAERSRRTRGRVEAAARHSIVFRPR